MERTGTTRSQKLMARSAEDQPRSGEPWWTPAGAGNPTGPGAILSYEQIGDSDPKVTFSGVFLVYQESWQTRNTMHPETFVLLWNEFQKRLCLSLGLILFQR